MNIQHTKGTQLCALYQKLDRLIAAGEVASAYGGAQNIDDPDGDVLSEFIEFIDEFYPDNRVDWLEAFYQVFAWQFQSCHGHATKGYAPIIAISTIFRKIKQSKRLLIF